MCRKGIGRIVVFKKSFENMIYPLYAIFPKSDYPVGKNSHKKRRVIPQGFEGTVCKVQKISLISPVFNNIFCNVKLVFIYDFYEIKEFDYIISLCYDSVKRKTGDF